MSKDELRAISDGVFAWMEDRQISTWNAVEDGVRRWLNENDAVSRWLDKNSVSMGDRIFEAVTSWLDANKEEIIQRLKE